MFRKIKGMKLKKYFELKNISTFHIGGKAKYFIECYNLQALIKIVKICTAHQLYYKIIGGASNLLFDDKGFAGVVIKYCNDSCIVNNDTITASAGVEMSNLIAVAKQNGLSGLENFAGIPCQLGGAIVNNLGANNVEISSLLTSATTIKPIVKNAVKNKKRKKTSFELSKYCKIISCNNKKINKINLNKNNSSNTNINQKSNNYKIKNKLKINNIKINKNTINISKNSFSYRKNSFLCNNEIITSAKIKLIKLNKNIIQNNLTNNYQKKHNSQPLNCYSAGSIFKRGKNFLPAKLIDDMELKGTKIGGAEISTKHAGFIVNTDNAKCQDVLNLINFIKQKAKKIYNLNFEEEVEYVPYNKN